MLSAQIDAIGSPLLSPIFRGRNEGALWEHASQVWKYVRHIHFRHTFCFWRQRRCFRRNIIQGRQGHIIRRERIIFQGLFIGKGNTVHAVLAGRHRICRSLIHRGAHMNGDR